MVASLPIATQTNSSSSTIGTNFTIVLIARCTYLSSPTMLKSGLAVLVTAAGMSRPRWAGRGDCPDRARDWPAGLRTECRAGPCAGQQCGVHAVCGAGGGCECEVGHEGDPAVRCFPRLATLCSCREIVLSTTSPASLAVQPGSFGVYYLAGAAAGHPVYQHESGQLFLYQQDGSWLVSDRVGSRAGGIQNQVGRDRQA